MAAPMNDPVWVELDLHEMLYVYAVMADLGEQRMKPVRDDHELNTRQAICSRINQTRNLLGIQ